MPWECQRCKTAIDTDDTATCPTCKSPKSNWTMQQDKTRNFVIARVKVEAWRGDGDAPAPLASDVPPPASPTARVVVLTKAEVRALVAEGRRPRASELLFVRLHPGKRQGYDVAITANLDRGEARELPPFPAFTAEPDPEGVVNVPFVFEYGAEPPLAESPFPGVHLVDLSEELAPGTTFAPSIDAVALRRPPIRLPAEPAEAPFFLSF